MRGQLRQGDAQHELAAAPWPVMLRLNILQAAIEPADIEKQ